MVGQLLQLFLTTLNDISGKQKYEKIILLIIEKKLLNRDGLLIVEHSKKTDLQNIENYIETRKYGDCGFSFFKL